MNAQTASQPDLLRQLRETLAGVEAELPNPLLFQYTRRQLEARAARLRWEIGEIERPTPFKENGNLVSPTRA